MVKEHFPRFLTWMTFASTKKECYEYLDYLPQLHEVSVFASKILHISPKLTSLEIIRLWLAVNSWIKLIVFRERSSKEIFPTSMQKKDGHSVQLKYYYLYINNCTMDYSCLACHSSSSKPGLPRTAKSDPDHRVEIDPSSTEL